MSDQLHEHPDFATFLMELGHGKANARLTDRLAEVVQGVEATGLKGKLVVTFDVHKKGDVAIVTVEDKSTIPQHPYDGSVFFFGHQGSLVRNDPKQMDLRGLEPIKLKTVED